MSSFVSRRRSRRRLVVEEMENRLLLASFTVNSTADDADVAADGVCETAPGNGLCTLRAAIQEADGSAGTDTISFNIPGPSPQTIQPLSALPTITDPVVIDGTTQPGFAGAPLIELAGSTAGAGSNGLLITAGNSTVRGLAVNRFDNNGIAILTNGGNVIEGNYLGTDVNGTVDLGNVGRGIVIADSTNNLIGGTAAGARNIVSANDGGGIIIVGSGATGNLVEGNFFGTDVTGTVALGNGLAGVDIPGGAGSVHIGFGAHNNTIGGTSAGAGNVISGNHADGIFMDRLGTTGNLVHGNLIGTDVTGTVALSNRFAGVHFRLSAGNNTIGGTVPGARNVISGNGTQGIYSVDVCCGAPGNIVQGNFIGTDVSGTARLGNGTSGRDGAGVFLDTAANNVIGGTSPGPRNVISANLGYGITMGEVRSSGNVVQGNYIGTDLTGTVGLGNASSGVYVASPNNTIGGTEAGAGNLISGNAFGIGINGRADIAFGNVVQGNLIGTNILGNAAIANREHGVIISETASFNTIGGLVPGARNTISGNGQDGVAIRFGAAAGNAVQGNFIGTDVTGTMPLPNGRLGVIIDSGAQNNVIGGTVPEARNIISGNGEGVQISGTSGNLVQGNFIGTDVTGTVRLRNFSFGVLIWDATGNTIGGTTPGARNVISGNIGPQVRILGTSARNNLVQGNLIGTDVTGTTALGIVPGFDGRFGVWITDAPNNTIGGSTPEVRNIISGSGGIGLAITGGGATGNRVQGNWIGADATGAAMGNGAGVIVNLGANSNWIGTDGDGVADALEGNIIAHNAGTGVLVRHDASVGNSIRGNAIFDNAYLGIDLAVPHPNPGAAFNPGGDGVTPNDPGDTDTGSNQFQNFPIISTVVPGAGTRVIGSLNSSANMLFTLDFYASAAADPSGFGEGQRYLGSGSVLTDGSGNATFDFALAGSSFLGEVITATATDPAGSTSEFSGGSIASNRSPSADAGGPYTVAEGSTVQLDASNSSDPDQPAR